MSEKGNVMVEEVSGTKKLGKKSKFDGAQYREDVNGRGAKKRAEPSTGPEGRELEKTVGQKGAWIRRRKGHDGKHTQKSTAISNAKEEAEESTTRGDSIYSMGIAKEHSIPEAAPSAERVIRGSAKRVFHYTREAGGNRGSKPIGLGPYRGRTRSGIGLSDESGKIKNRKRN